MKSFDEHGYTIWPDALDQDSWPVAQDPSLEIIRDTEEITEALELLDIYSRWLVQESTKVSNIRSAWKAEARKRVEELADKFGWELK